MSRKLLAELLEQQRREKPYLSPPPNTTEIFYGYYYVTPLGEVYRNVPGSGTWVRRKLKISKTGYCTPCVEGRKYSYRPRRTK